MDIEVMVDADTLREQVKEKYRELAANPRGSFHFHTGRPLAARLGYDERLTASFPESAVESFAGVANPFSLRSLPEGERVVDFLQGDRHEESPGFRWRDQGPSNRSGHLNVKRIPVTSRLERRSR